MRIITRILKKNREVRSELGYFGLSSWWSSTFSPVQRQYMETLLQSPEMRSGAKQTATGLLVLLADKLGNQPEDRFLACRVLAKAEERALAGEDLLGLHLTYHQMIRIHVKWKREFRDASDLALAASDKQIRLASRVAAMLRAEHPDTPLPVHLGYLHAASVLEQEGGLSRAIEVCREAQAEGWSGDWSWRIQRMARRLHEQRPQAKPISPSGMGPV